MAAFAFKYDVDAAHPPNDSFVAVVPSGISETNQLLKVLSERLNLPAYFGFNWNALEECLRDFHWVDPKTIILVHEDLPALTRSDLLNYLQVLDSSVHDWRPEEDHKLVVAFPKCCQETIERLAENAQNR